jgi:hypothetical protein
MRASCRAIRIGLTQLVLALVSLGFGECASAEATFLVDAIPTGATVLGAGAGNFAYQDLDQVDPAVVKGDLAATVEQLKAMAAEKSASYVCLLSAYGNDTREYRFGASDMKIRLNAKHPQLYIAMFKDGSESMPHISYRTTGAPAEPHVTYQVRKVSIPAGSNDALFLFFNLTRLQVDAAKAGASEIYIGVTGTGKTSTVALPGLSEPLTIYDGDMTITESWTIPKTPQLVPSGASGDPISPQ